MHSAAKPGEWKAPTVFLPHMGSLEPAWCSAAVTAASSAGVLPPGFSSSDMRGELAGGTQGGAE